MERVRCSPDSSGDLLETLRALIPTNGVIAVGGMSGSSLPKVFPKVLKELLRGGDYSITLLTGGATSESFEESISEVSGSFKARYPFLSGGVHRDMANSLSLRFFDYGLYKFNRMVRNGSFSIDLAVIEGTAIDDQCRVTPSLSLDSSTSFLKVARKVVVEVNVSKPDLEGIHDVVDVDGPISLTRVRDRIGSPKIRIPKDKISGVVISDSKESSSGAYKTPSVAEERVSRNLMDFLVQEIGKGHTRELYERSRFVIQPGAGSLSSAMSTEVQERDMRVSIWAETLPVKWAFLLGEKVDSITSSALFALHGEERYLEEFYQAFSMFKDLTIRGQEVTNNPEVIQRLELVSILQAIEVDIYGNVNVSHIGGKVYNGVGGSVDFAPNAYLTVIALPSTTSNGRVSRVSPMVSHVDIPEHYVDVVVTDQGYADLRGLSPSERAELLIEKCAHPTFKDSLLKYHEKVKLKGHEGHDLVEMSRIWGVIA
ncbi:hypothetical protein GWK48_10820 [Metallosphaera tengchongensis]|uniref:Uncharacterized protein n=1 Tax=Metallosphaera tengchongensis TaxID=1532350 RepID=A0A6N0P0K9_9CREN|nr:acetyl-CoA hydrolase/transferase C-terminal domain-containing protein [Metallosphaera tengchongensis]QKR00810.1 hypothetical protein GWK48_10820 [Metallosphaera tengchongensis]